MVKYPMLLTPAFKDYIWGGTRLREDYGKKCGLDKIAESWELSCHPDGVCVIENGEYAGMTLAEYVMRFPEALGSDCARFDRFPVLIKLIDAHDRLSVQVHPDNEYALAHENEYGKTEMWYIADCEDGAELLYGFTHEITREEFCQRIAENTLLETVKSVPVHKGDVFFIGAGTLHAIGKGIVIAEIQQNSNTTYRIYDYGRKGSDGKPRPLHTDKAAEVTRLEPAPAQKIYPEENGVRKLAECEYFTVSRVAVSDKAELFASDASFTHILTLEGCAELTRGDSPLTLSKGTGVFIPAGSGKLEITGCCELITTTV